MGNRRRHIADQGSRASAFRNRAFGWVIGGVEIKIREVPNHPVWPIFGR